ncbi:MAG: hypothetical protein JKY19_07225 [Alcanivoracaceae bacterium]|nr:hypothetical protein [Alcanivoracaceae bacterium]
MGSALPVPSNWLFCLLGEASKPVCLKESRITLDERGRQSEWQGRNRLTVGSEGSHRKLEVHNANEPDSAVLEGKRAK